MQEKRTKPGEKAKHDLNEKTTYRFGNRSFIVEPVFKEETQNTLGCVLLRLMKSESAGGAAPCHECAPSLYKKSEQAMYSLLRHESKDHVLIPNAHPANFSL